MVSCLSLLEYKFDIVAVTETWLDSKDNSQYQLEGYTAYFCSRVGKKGGGVGLYVSNSLKHKYLIDMSYCIQNCAELVCVEVTL